MVASAVEKAYQAAEAEIRGVLDAGETRLDFSGEQFRALQQSPAAVREITGLIHLNLNRTAVADLTPISLLTAPQDLSLNDTDVADLAPIAGLTSPKSLSFDETDATGLLTASSSRVCETLRVRSRRPGKRAALPGIAGASAALSSSRLVPWRLA